MDRTILPLEREISGMTTVGDVIKMIEELNRKRDPNFVIDSAMPQPLVDRLIHLGFDPRGKCAMFYSFREWGPFGSLRGLCVEWDRELSKFMEVL